MIRIGCVLAVLAACGGASEHATTSLNAGPGCPAARCPSCPPSTCPPAVCPGCPLAPAPSVARSAPPKPEARDWYCHRYVNNKRERTTMCWVSRELCERERRTFYRKRKGKTTACVPQHVAYCLQAVQARSMARSFLCSQNMNDCERTRRRFQRGVIVVEHVTECREMLNIDPYEQPVAFPPDSLPE